MIHCQISDNSNSQFQKTIINYSNENLQIFFIIIKNHRSSLKDYKCNFLSIQIKAKENGTFSYNKDYFNSYSEIKMSYNDTKKLEEITMK